MKYILIALCFSFVSCATKNKLVIQVHDRIDQLRIKGGFDANDLNILNCLYLDYPKYYPLMISIDSSQAIHYIIKYDYSIETCWNRKYDSTKIDLKSDYYSIQEILVSTPREVDDYYFSKEDHPFFSISNNRYALVSGNKAFIKYGGDKIPDYAILVELVNSRELILKHVYTLID